MNLNCCLRKLLAALVISSAAGPLSSHALEITIVESRSTGTNFPWYAEGLGNWANSTAKSTAAGVTPGIGSRFASAESATFSVSPVLQDGATYTIDITHGESSSIPDPFDTAVTVIGGTIDVTNTPAFARFPQNTWERVGTITLDPGVTTPTVTFTKLTTGTGRFYADAVRFILDDPCLRALPELATVNGPLGEGQLYVDVPGVAAEATAVSVYANGVLIGRKSEGVTAGVNRVTTSALVKNDVITVTQTDINAVESCRPVTGPTVGGGPNPRIRMALSIRQNTNLLGPIGRDGGTTTTPSGAIKFLGASNVVTVNGTAPVGNRVFYPSNDWQTVEFLRGDDPANPVDVSYRWNGPTETDPHQLKGDFGVLDAIAMAIDDQDTGPYVIYIDSFRNGSTLVQGFEGSAIGAAEVGFRNPSFSGTTTDFLLSKPPGSISPNRSVVTNDTADAGAHSLLVSWQFKDTNAVNWLRLTAFGAIGTPNPVLDLRQPISFRMLILPVGQQPPQKPADATTGPGNQRVIEGGTITMRFNYGGTPPFTFQWRRDGVDIPDATNATLTVNNAQLSDAGDYTVVVANALGSDESPSGTLTVEDVPYTDVMTLAWRLPTGSRTYIANDNNTRSIAFNPLSGNLLVASRSGGANIHVLNGETGAFLHTLQPPAGGYTGGTLVLNQVVASPDDGTIYAGNLAENGTTTNFKLYRWLGDDPSEVPTIVWEGNPSADPNLALRWGDAMMLRDDGAGGDQIILSSRTGALLSLLQPDFGDPTIPAVVCNITDAPGNSFGLGLAGEGLEVVWGKITGSPLLRVQPDFGVGTGAILHSFTGLDNMGPIGINSAGTLLAGVFIDTPDHLRLFDISTPGQIVALDTELFPSDNANGNATGGIAFGNNKVYALCSNNGLLAMNIDTSCLPDRATITRDGSNVIISWDRSTYRLQGTDALGGTWNDIPGDSPVTLGTAAPGGMQFFRLICP